MTSFGDKPYSRWKPRRLVRRATQMLAVAAMLLVAFILILAAAFSNEAFWRRVLIPLYVGPLWETVLDYDSLTPQAFPPGVRIENLRLRDPGADRTLVARVEDFHLTTGWDFRHLDISNLTVRGVTLNYVVQPDGNSNLNLAMERLFDQMPPPERLNDRVREGEELFPRVRLRSASIRELTVRYEDQRDPARPLIASWISPGEVRLVLQENAAQFRAGYLDEYLRAEADGEWSVRAGEWTVEGPLAIVAELPRLGRFPNTVARLEATARPAEGGRVLTVSAELPMERLAVRALGTPLEKLHVEFLAEGNRLPLVAFHNGRLDPLRGDLEGDLAVEASWEDLLGTARAFLDEEEFRRAEAALAEALPRRFVRRMAESAAIAAEARLKASGLLQYAIIDEQERVPLQLETSGTAGLRHVEAGAVRELLPGYADTVPLEHSDLVPMDVDLKWKLTAGAAENFGTLWLDLDARPSVASERDVRLGLRLSRRDRPEEPVRFRPFGEPLGGLLTRTLETTPTLAADYRFLPEYEPAVRLAGARLRGAVAAMDAVELGDAMLTQRLSVTDPGTLDALLHPFWNVDSATSASLAMSLSREAPGRPAIFRSEFHLDGARLPGIDEPIALDGHGEVSIEGPVVTFHDFETSLRRGPQGEGRVLGFGLAHRLPDGIEGPPLPTRVDLETGEAHAELEVTTIRREIVEVLLQLQTFGLSERLAQPLNRRFLRLLGFGPEDRSSTSEATIFVTADMGPVARVRSVLAMRDLPADNFLLPERRAESASERFHARLLQAASLDRRTETLRPEAFDLELATTRNGADVPFAALRLEPDEGATLSYAALLELADVEVEQFRADAFASPRRVKALLAGLFERLNRFRAASSGAGGRLVFELPAVDLSQFSRTLTNAGLPVEQGVLDLRLVTALRGGGPASRTTATGRFSLTGLRFREAAETLPDIEGVLDLGHGADRLVLNNVSAEMTTVPGTAAPMIRFEGWTNISDDASHWELRLDHANATLLDGLRRVRTAGVGSAASLLEGLPFSRLAEIAGTQGEINLLFEADTDTSGTMAQLHARQQGRDLIVFPSLFAPLSFDLRQRLITTADGSVTVEALQGSLREEGLRQPLMELSLDRPLRFGNGAADTGAPVLSVLARKDLGEIARRLEAVPIPLLERRLESGQAQGRIDVRFERDSFDSPGDIEAVSSFDFALTGVRLEGVEGPLDGSLRGDLRRTSDTLTLSDMRLEAVVDGAPAGAVTGQAEYDLGLRLASATVRAHELRSRLLAILPEPFSRWGTLDSARLNGEIEAAGLPDTGDGEMDLTLRARDFALPAVALSDGSEYRHPPLQFDLDLSAAWDSQTSTVLVQQVSALLAKGDAPADGDSLEPMGEKLAPLVRVTESAPFRYMAGSGDLSRDNLPGAGMNIEAGPLDMREYGPPLRALTGISLVEGSVGGNGSIVATGAASTRIDVNNLGFFLRRGIWERPDGSLLPVEADLVFRGGTRPDVLRLEELTALIRYPETPGEEDHFSATGYSERQAGIDHLELAATSRGIDLNRVLAFTQDMEAWRQRADTPRTADAPDGKPRPWKLPERTTATLIGQLDNIRFRELRFPRTELRARYADGRVDLDDFRSRLDEGLVAVTGAVDFSAPAPPWELNLRVEDLEARPWVNSFATAKARDTVSGRFLASARLRGAGFTEDEVARNLVAEGIFGVRQGEVIDEGFRAVFGPEADFSADLRLLVRNNRALFELGTPWNPARDVLMQGTILNLFGQNGEPPWLRALVDYNRTTVVGPRWRRVTEDGARVPLRQDLFGMVMEIAGPVKENEAAELRLRSLNW